MPNLQTRTLADGSKRYRVAYRLDGKQTSDTFDDEDAAQRQLRRVREVGPEQARAALEAEAKGPGASSTTVAEWTAHHLEVATGITDGTRSEYARLAERTFLKVLGRRSLDTLTSDDVRRWVNAQTKTPTRAGTPTSSKTIVNAHGLLSTVLSSAVEAGLITKNPAKGIPISRGEHKEMVFLTEGEFTRLLGHIPQHYVPFVLFLASTGCRWGEATALSWGDVDLDSTQPFARIRRAWKKGPGAAKELGTTKTRRGVRRVPLYPDLVALLRPLRGAPESFVFTSPRQKVIANHTFHMRVWQPAVSAFAGDEVETVWEPGGPGRRRRVQKVIRKGPGKRPRVHDLRHCAASWMVHGDADPLLVQNALGHEDIRTTLGTYGHLRGDALAVQASIMQRVLAGAAPQLEPDLLALPAQRGVEQPAGDPELEGEAVEVLAIDRD